MLALPPVSAARFHLAALAVFVSLTSVAAAGTRAQPGVTLLAPANGTLAESGNVEFRWRVDSAQTTADRAVTVTHQIASDLGFTQDVTTTARSCPAANVNCWTTYRATRPYAGRRYWRVSVTGAATAASPTWMFQGVAARQGPDWRRPRVRAYRGTATRGRKAIFVARVSDDRGEARIQVEFTYRNQLVVRAMTLLKPVRWSVNQRFDSRVAIPRTFPPGMYRLCVTAWDRTGNRARDCAAYRVR